MLSLKIKLADDIRRVSVADSTSYDELCSLVQSLFGLAPNTFSFKYTDEDGDLITISAPCDWTEASAATRPLTLVVVSTPASTTAATPAAVAPTPISASVSEFELLLTSQQQRAADEQQAVAAAPEPLPFLSASVEPVAAAAADAAADEQPAAPVNVDELPLADRLEALLVELVYSGEHVIDEVVASLKRSTADLDASSIALSLELFLKPLRDSLRSGGTKACGLLADLQEHAQSSMLLARIASVISLAGEALQKHTANVDMTEVSRRVRSFNLREHITSFIRSIENHPQVTLLVSTLKDKLAAAKAAANSNDQPPAVATTVVQQEEPRIAARFVTDVTIPDDSQLVRGVPVTKTWRVRNSGNVQWPAGMYLEQGELRVALPTPMPDEEIDISTELRPADLGLITEYFNLCDPSGTPRLRLWARVHVVDPVVPEPAVSAEFTAALEQLQTLGFAPDAAAAALVATEGNFHDAMDLLCASSNE